MATGNSLTHIENEDNNRFLIKRFKKNREYHFFHEYFINKYLSHIDKKYVARIHKINKINCEIYYEYFPQTKIIGNHYSSEYLQVIKSIHRHEEKSKIQIKLYAKESLKSIPQTLIDIEKRIQNLLEISNQKKRSLINHISDLEGFLNIIKINIFEKSIFSREKFSQADSGLHNCILDNEGKLLLTDLEYAGLDSPIKQCADYLLHPQNKNDNSSNKNWLNYFIEYCIDEKDLKNLNYFFSLFALKWATILLNEFIPEIWETRIHASPLRKENHDKILENQLKKSKIYLKVANKIIDNEEYTKLFSKSERFFISKSY